MLQLIYSTPLRWVVMLAPLAFVLVLSFGINRMRASTAQALFWAFAAVMGLSLSSIFLVYTGSSIAKTFFITAATFGAMSLYGYTTKRDLTGLRLVPVHGPDRPDHRDRSSTCSCRARRCISPSRSIGVLIFTGLTAYDTQKIKEMYFAGDGAETSRPRRPSWARCRSISTSSTSSSIMLQLLGDRR